MQARLVASRLIAPDVKHFVFEVPETETLPYESGQFVSFTREFDGKPITRAYSTASAPSANRFELCLNRVSDGIMSPWLFTIQPGETVEMTGPLGYFTLRDPARECIFAATGTGIAPFRGMLLEHLPAHPELRATLVFGVRYEASLMYRDEFEALARKYPNFRFWPVLSRPDDSWQGRTGHIQPYVLEALGDRRDIDVYICGLHMMVDDLRTQLKGLGLDRKRIICEKYD